MILVMLKACLRVTEPFQMSSCKHSFIKMSKEDKIMVIMVKLACYLVRRNTNVKDRFLKKYLTAIFINIVMPIFFCRLLMLISRTTCVKFKINKEHGCFSWNNRPGGLRRLSWNKIIGKILGCVCWIRSRKWLICACINRIKDIRRKRTGHAFWIQILGKNSLPVDYEIRKRI